MVEVQRTVKLDDLRSILARPRTIELATAASPDAFLHLVETRETTGSTLFDDGVPMIAGGVTRLLPPYAFVWVVASGDIKNYLLTLAREVKAAVKEALDAGLVLCTNVPAGQPDAERFAKYLGFTPQPGKYWELRK
jgi:hypothetical protein